MGYRQHQTSLIYQSWTRAQNGNAEHVSMVTEITETLIFGAFHHYSNIKHIVLNAQDLDIFYL